ncbi:hypothetical protein CC85DRAFT_304959 [Cutaneotrichosporon oleaginosum]|uniref:Uncharacterized protein n=1 Tax=Cutaneotrichosporon oleaginosum TaxID=879819 RepID=A0A0J0XEN2_9TREE|nr:uncharacterized protein CC85DRAFT_304959 [Cutaneotrichosporon oleaginosum]KLT39530.1 hypothetical protein CC85DRAFT_304959 [Cutaneotrichosporon oleaginosum]TXT07071.1 hypothetical protein COLE_06402 [Cutaneotrichosporon oleaginosum]
MPRPLKPKPHRRQQRNFRILHPEDVACPLPPCTSSFNTMPNRNNWALTIPDSPQFISPNQPKYLVVFLRTGIKSMTVQALLDGCIAIRATGLKAKTSGIHVHNFHQNGFGVWRRYSELVFISADTRDAKAEEAAASLKRLYDTAMGTRPLRFLRQCDPDTARKMAVHHREVHRQLGEDMGHSVAVMGHPVAVMGHPVAVETTQTRKMGGMGTILTVSFGEAVKWHKDADDFVPHYSVVCVAGHQAFLYLKGEINCRIRLQPGAVI